MEKIYFNFQQGFRLWAVLALSLFLSQDLFSQVRLRVTINSGSSGTTCSSGGWFGSSNPRWRMNIAGQGWTTYPRAGLCFTNPPNTQYDETFDCPNSYPNQLNICFRAFQDNGSLCIVNEACVQTLCQNIPAPAPGTSSTHTLTVPNNGANNSWGTVSFTITATGSFGLPGSNNDFICDAINLGTIPMGGSLGNRNLSNYGNFCASNVGDPPTPWDNDQGVWFQFRTGPRPAAVMEIESRSDPQNLGRGINLQLALYESTNNTCTGNLSLVESAYQPFLGFNQTMNVECLRPNTTYFLLVDGESLPLLGGGIGYFGLQINDNGIVQAGDEICDAEDLGTVPDGPGFVGTGTLNRSNVCATNTNDPTPAIWSPLQPVWFSFIAPSSGNAIIEATSDLPFPLGQDAIDLQLALYSTMNNTCSGILSYVDASYNPIGFNEEMNVRCLDPGRRYWLMVDGSNLNRDGIFDIRIRDGGVPPAPNDLICDAIPLGAPTPGNTVGLTNQNNYCADNIFEPSPSNWGNVQGVWYSFVAPPSGKVEVRANSQGLFGNPIDLQLAVYDSDDMTCTGSLTEIRSRYTGFGLVWNQDMEVECLIPGRTYYIMVDGQGSLINPGLQEGIFDIEVYADPRDPAAPNDDICDAINLGDPGITGQVRTGPGVNHGTQNNFCATAAGEPNPSSFTPSQTVWYEFTAPPSGNIRLRAISDDILGGVDAINLQYGLWEASNNNCTGGTFREVSSGSGLLYNIDREIYCLDPGRPYFLQIDGSPPAFLGGDEGYFDIIIDTLAPIPVAPNDLICDAIDLGNPWASGPQGAVDQHNRCANDIGDPQPSAFSTSQTVWYSVQTPATGGPYAMTVEGTSGLPWPFGSGDAIDLQLAVWASDDNSCTGNFTEVASSYFPIPFDETVQAQCLEAGRTYYIMVNGSFLARQGVFDISVRASTPVPIPVNDDICDAVDLGTVPVGGQINDGVDYSNFCATTEPGEPAPFNIRQTVWFSFEAPAHAGPQATSDVRVRVVSDPGNLGDNIDLQLAVYESSNDLCTGNLRLLDSDDPLLTRNAQVDLTCLYPGRRYFVQVDGSLLDRQGYFRIQLEDRGSGIRPTNDAICDAIALGAVPNGGQINNGVEYLNLCASTEPGEPNPSAFGIEQTVWFTFEAPASGNVTIVGRSDPFNSGESINIEFAVYQAANNNCAGPFIEIDSRVNSFSFNNELSLECLVPGGIYYLQVDGSSGVLGGQDGYFSLRIEDDGGVSNFPYNNDICDAFNFGVPTGAWFTLNNETNECANVEFGEPGVGNYATNTVWYQFTAPPSARVRIEVTSSNALFGMDPEVYLFSSSDNTCSGNFTRIESSNLPTALITERIDATCLLPGNTYFIQVDGSGLVIEGDFRIRIRDLEPLYATGQPGDPEPSNNLCANAIPLTVQASSCSNGSGSFNMLNYGYPTISHNPPFVQGCNGNCGDTWYSFTMPSTGVVGVEGNDDNIGGGLLGDFSELTVVAYTGTCNNLTPIDCSSGGLFDDVSLEIAAAPGSTVYLQVFNDDGDDDGENYELCISQGCGADNCLNALAYPISPNIPYCFNTAGATGDDVIGGAPGYFNCGRNTNPRRSLYFSFVSDCNGSDVTINILNAFSNAGCILGTVPQDGFSVSFFEDATPCDNNPDLFIDCETFNSCMGQPINWSETYTNLTPNTNYIIQIEGGFNFLGGANNSGEIMIQTQTSPSVLPVATPLSCSGLPDGEASALVVGGVAPYSFEWSTGATDSTITGLASALYNVTVTSANGCEDTASVFVPASPNNLLANISSLSNVNCNGACNGTATVVGFGGIVSSGYSYQWDAAAANQTTSQATGLCPGVYTVSVEDNGGCLATNTVTITEPPAMQITLNNTTDAACAGVCTGTAAVSVSGGTIAFAHRYTWSDGQTTATATGLCPGIYSVTAIDDIGCPADLSVTISQPAGITASLANQTDLLCNGGASGSAQVTAANGNAPYTYSIDGSFGSSSSFTNLAAGAYTITVEDASGCQAYLPITINEPAALDASLVSSIDASCFGASDAELTVVATAGTVPYEYSLDGLIFQASGNFSNLDAGTYTVTVRDANACTFSLPVVLNEPAGLNLSIANQTASACGICDGSAEILTQGGAAPYTYLWSNGETTASATGLCAGNALVTVTDANACTASLSIPIQNAGNLAGIGQITSDISCPTTCDGALEVSPVGGTPPYSFLWSTSETTSTVSALCAGSYSVTVTDQNACVLVQNFSLIDPLPLNLQVGLLSPPSCPGELDAQALATTSGGTGSYNYLWPDGTTAAQNNNLAAGSYTLSVSDANACATTATISISDPAQLSVAITNVQASACGTVCDGSAQIQVQGGTAPYSYLWADGQTGASATNLCPGFQAITVTDNTGCTATDNINVPASTGLSLNLDSQSNPSCPGNCDGSAQVSASGGTLPYQYIWSNGEISANITGLCQGQYLLTVTDDDGCLAALAVDIVEPSPLNLNLQILSNYNGQALSCNNSSDARLGSTTSGGTAPYSFLWSDGQTTAEATAIPAGTYNLTVTDANGCSISDTETILAPPTILVSTSISSDYNGSPLSCTTSADAQADASVSGGTGSYSFFWSNGQTSAQATGLAAGTTTVTVSDANACTASASVTIVAPLPLDLNVAATSNYQGGFALSCHNSSDGELEATASGGTAPYSYLWASGETTRNLSGLSASTYELTVTDANGCTNSASFTLSPPPVLNLSASLLQTVSCHAGSDARALAQVQGGVAPYSYNWSNGETNTEATNLAAGLAQLTVSDANACTASTSVSVTEPSPLALQFVGIVDANCQGQASGSARASGSGGTAPYIYNWSNGFVGEQAISLAAATYTVTITDANGCSLSETLTIVEPSALALSTAVISNYNGQQLSCADSDDALAEASASGGTAPYSYSWVNGQTTAIASGLQASNYPLTVTDANGCSIATTVTVVPPPVLGLTTTVVSTYNGFEVSCHGAADGAVNALGQGGTGVISYLWSDGQTTANASGMLAGEYALTVTDANGCIAMITDTLRAPSRLDLQLSATQNVSCQGGSDGSATLAIQGSIAPYGFLWSDGATSQNRSNLAAGSYGLTASDANGCTASLSLTIAEPPALSLNLSSTMVSCVGTADGTATALGNAGTSPYSYLWSNGQTTAQATGLAAGSYALTLTDANGCQISNSVQVGSPPAVGLSLSLGAAVSCQGTSTGSITSNVATGTPPFTYLWSTGATSANLNNLAAGTYSLTVTDQRGCQSSETISLGQPSGIQVSSSILSNYNGAALSCAGSQDGEAQVQVSGATAPYSYLWSDGQTTAIITGLQATRYIVTITDANGCTDTSSVHLFGPQPLEHEVVTISDILCFGDSNGSAFADVSGGTPGYSFTWSNGETGATATNLTATQHFVTITDTNGCSVTNAVSIYGPQLLRSFGAFQESINCHGGADGQAFVDFRGGEFPFSYTWSNGTTTAVASGLSAGSYSVTVVDANGCSASDSVRVLQPDPILLDMRLLANASCQGRPDGQATAVVRNGQAPYRFRWSNGNRDSIATNLPAGWQYLTVTDDNNCESRDSVFIQAPDALSLDVFSSDINCSGNNDGRAWVVASGGTQPYSYAWSNGQSLDSIGGLSPGLLLVTVTDASGCSALESVFIRQPAAFSAQILSTEDPSCEGEADGAIRVQAAGGTGQFVFTWSHGPVDTSQTNISAYYNLPAGVYGITVSDASGCLVELDTSLSEPGELRLSGQGNRTRCYNSFDGRLDVEAQGGTPPYQYRMLPRGAVQTEPVFENILAGSYQVEVVDALGCTASSLITIRRPDSVLLETSPDLEIEIGDSAQLFVRMPVNSPYNPQVSWSPQAGLSCSDCYQPMASPLQSTIYTVTIVGDDDCPVQASIEVLVKGKGDVFIPNAFTPNGDGLNDIFMVYSRGGVARIKRMMVFDRWGELLFENSNGRPNFQGFGWDGSFRGKPMNTGVYVYMVEVEYLDGQVELLKGDVTLMR